VTAKDIIHEAVRAALTKDGWTITDDPLFIGYRGLKLYADLAAERSAAPDAGRRRVVVEVKSFVGQSAMYDFQHALGQYLVYRACLEQRGSDQELFLAVPFPTYARFFRRNLISMIVNRYEVGLLVVDVTNREVVRWTR
jgi:hypothetical protein